VSQSCISLTAHFDLRDGATLLANMLIALVDADSSFMSTQANDEHPDHQRAPQQAGVHLRASVDPGAGAPQPGEHRTPIRPAGQGVGPGVAATIGTCAGPGSGPVGRPDERARGLQDLGVGRGDGPGRRGVCAGSVASGAVEPRLAPPAGAVRADAHAGDRCRWLLRPGRLQRRAAVGSEGHDGAGRAAFSARAPPGRQAEQGAQGGATLPVARGLLL
jgi:hypothetical protein